jgi:hypothetical protein
LTAAKAASSQYAGKKGYLVKIDTSANFTVTIAANNAIAEGIIVVAQPHPVDTWHVAVQFFGYYDVTGAWHSGSPNVGMLYYGSGSVALGQHVITENASGTDYNKVDGVNTGGMGKIIAIDDPQYYVHFFY